MQVARRPKSLTGRLYQGRRITAALWAIALGLVWPIAAWAHPLGNFTINRYSRLEPGSKQIQLHYVVDVAEVPALAEQERIDRDGDGLFSETERKEYLGGQVFALHRNLSLLVNGQPLPLVPYAARLDFPPGQGGLLTVRLAIDFTARLPVSPAGWQAEYQDNNYANRRLGWQEIVVQAGPGVTLLESTAPAEDVSQELRAYPPELLQQPLQVRQASFRFRPTAADKPVDRAAGSDQPVSRHQSPLSTPPSPYEASNLQAYRNASQSPISNLQSPNLQSPASLDAFANLITIPTPGPGAIILALLAAFGWGTAHAFSPGHGKTVVAAYLVGSHGTARHALFLGLTTTLTHTAGVFALGGLTLFMSYFIVPEQLYPWLGVVSGLLVVTIGLSLFISRLRHNHHHDHSHRHGHTHDHHHHHHPHAHDHPPLSSSPEGGIEGGVTWRSLLALGVSGGLLPCPSAMIVMLGAIALHRVGFGLILIVAFSLGLASVLTATGLLFVYAGRLFNRLPVSRPFLGALPLVSALVVTILGVGITWQALAQMGVY